LRPSPCDCPERTTKPYRCTNLASTGVGHRDPFTRWPGGERFISSPEPEMSTNLQFLIDLNKARSERRILYPPTAASSNRTAETMHHSHPTSMPNPVERSGHAQWPPHTSSRTSHPTQFGHGSCPTTPERRPLQRPVHCYSPSSPLEGEETIRVLGVLDQSIEHGDAHAQTTSSIMTAITQLRLPAVHTAAVQMPPSLQSRR